MCTGSSNQESAAPFSYPIGFSLEVFTYARDPTGFTGTALGSKDLRIRNFMKDFPSCWIQIHIPPPHPC